MTRAILALLLLAACASPEEAPAPEPETVTFVTALTVAPVVVIDPQIATEVDAAIDLWSRATNGAYAPEDIRFVRDHIPDCGGAGGKVGCWDPLSRTITLSVKAQKSHRVAVLAHEMGHSLGLRHTPSGLMAEDHPSDNPCISAEDAAATGLGGPGACLVEP
jgi:hypothetical protein